MTRTRAFRCNAVPHVSMHNGPTLLSNSVVAAPFESRLAAAQRASPIRSAAAAAGLHNHCGCKWQPAHAIPRHRCVGQTTTIILCEQLPKRAANCANCAPRVLRECVPRQGHCCDWALLSDGHSLAAPIHGHPAFGPAPWHEHAHTLSPPHPAASWPHPEARWLPAPRPPTRSVLLSPPRYLIAPSIVPAHPNMYAAMPPCASGGNACPPPHCSRLCSPPSPGALGPKTRMCQTAPPCAELLTRAPSRARRPRPAGQQRSPWLNPALSRWMRPIS